MSILSYQQLKDLAIAKMNNESTLIHRWGYVENPEDTKLINKIIVELRKKKN